MLLLPRLLVVSIKPQLGLANYARQLYPNTESSVEYMEGNVRDSPEMGKAIVKQSYRPVRRKAYSEKELISEELDQVTFPVIVFTSFTHARTCFYTKFVSTSVIC